MSAPLPLNARLCGPSKPVRMPLRAWFVAVAIGGALLAPTAVHAVGVGARAPEIGLSDLRGRPVRIADLRGKVVLVDFWASWCEPCRAEFPFLNRLHERYARRGLVIVGVSVDERLDAVRNFLRRTPALFRIVHDPGHVVANRYAPPRMPSSYLIDRRGIVRHVHGGFRASDEPAIERRVRELVERP